VSRQEEINEIMPEDDNCPGPNCLRVTNVDRSQHRQLKVVHEHPPWHHNYPPEMSNIYSSNKAGVKVTGGTSDYQKQRAVTKKIFS